MLLADMAINAIDAALEYREISLHRVRVGVPSDVLFDRMIDRLMGGEARADLGVNRGLIGAKVCVLGDSFYQDRFQRLCRHVGDMARVDLAAALYERHDGFMLR